jgi:DNA gyrase subunit B
MIDETTNSGGGERTAEEQAAHQAGIDNYAPEDVQVLKNAAHIRKRPGMYIGDTATKGLHHLVYELVYNSVDEALAGFCRTIQVKLNVDGSCSVADDGRGIPVEMHPVEKRPTLEVVMTTVGAGGKFEKGVYKVSAGLHGMGAKAVTALSEWTLAEVRRNGKVYQQEYERGHPITQVKEIGAAAGKRTGTTVTFKPDPQIFRDREFKHDVLETHLRELAFLNKGLVIKLLEERDNKEYVYHYAGGVAEFVEHLNKEAATLHKPIYIEKVVENRNDKDEVVSTVRVEVALQYTDSDEERIYCYANNAHNPGGGTHLTGFRKAVTATLNDYGEKEGLFKNIKPQGEDAREGLTAIVSVQVAEPQFESQTKVRLNNPEVDGAVQKAVGEQLNKFLEENPKDAQRIIRRVISAAEAREAAAKARKALKDRKSILSSGGLPGKLMDCTSRDPDESELFLVEGQSAGGSAEQGRERQYQAILPLRGKVLNVEKARQEKVLGNEEICNLISAVGVDIGYSEEPANPRYGKVVILTDADVDGQHIRTLLLTFFYRQMRKLIEDGHVFVARPPLFKVTQKKHVRFVQTMEEMTGELMKRGLDGTRLQMTELTADAVQGMAGVAARPAAALEGERLGQLVEVLNDVEEALQILERRGLHLAGFLARATAHGLPVYRVTLGAHEHWFATAAEVDAFRQSEQQRLGHELVVGDELRTAVAAADGTAATNGNGHAATLYVQELHEVHKINRGLERLREFGLGGADLVPLPRVAGREPPQRFRLQNGDAGRWLPHLRELVAEVRKIGERGLAVTRFKGLGEMDPDELWETTLDPAKRTLLKVQLDDAVKADEMFRTLMGEKVEPRRDFIQKHALEVKELDYHGA